LLFYFEIIKEGEIIITDDAKRMAELLRKGHTMLNMSCPVCQSPVFRDNDDQLYCPTCNRSVKIVNKSSPEVENGENKIERKAELSEDKKVSNKDLKDELRDILAKKIRWLASQLKNETQTELIEKYVKLISETYELLSNI
jgi:uncharacterized Zn finger protein (UPF0148 family)